MGCAYVKARLMDFADIVRLEAGVSVGIGADATLFRTWGVGYGYAYDGYYVQLLGPRIGIWRFKTAVVAPHPLAFFLMNGWGWKEEKVVNLGRPIRSPEAVRQRDGQHTALFNKDMDMVTLTTVILVPGVPYLVDGVAPKVWMYPQCTNATTFECGVRIVGPIYFRFSFCIDEFFDFLLGWFGIDPMHDDTLLP